MSYPQPNSNRYAINGYQFFRLNTLLSSPGDIYESEQSGLALCLGPESDVSKVACAYYDDQVPTFINSTIVDPNRSFVGRLDARNDSRYQPSNRPGRILFWSADLYDPSYVPSASLGFTLTDAVQRIAPRLDVLQYFQAPASLVTRRADKEYRFEDYTLANGSTWIIFPSYGRKYCSVVCTNNNTKTDGSEDFIFRVIGLNYAAPKASGAPTTQETVIYSGPLAVNDSKVVNNVLGAGTATNAAMFDAVMVCIRQYPTLLDTDTNRVPLRVYFSDEP
jgi:hypothetical protein